MLLYKATYLVKNKEEFEKAPTPVPSVIIATSLDGAFSTAKGYETAALTLGGVEVTYSGFIGVEKALQVEKTKKEAGPKTAKKKKE